MTAIPSGGAVRDARRLALGLILFTLLYNAGEGAISIWSGLRADSLVLLAFGADSYVEVLAAGAVAWRLAQTGEEKGEQAERRALRFIGVTFLLLAVGVAFEAVYLLSTGAEAEKSLAGTGLLAASLVVMPPLAFWKLRVAARGNLPALAAEARETFACVYLSITALAGIVAVTLAGWGWVDAIAALLMTPWLAREGLEALRGET